MNVIVFGAGKIFTKFMMYKEICLPDVKICYICDNDKKLDGMSICGISIISPESLEEKIHINDIHAILIVTNRIAGYDIYDQIHHMSLDVDVYCIMENVLDSKLACNSFSDIYMGGRTTEELLKDIFYIKDKPHLPYLEYDIVDHCNLKCNGCGHLSNIAQERYVAVPDFEKDIRRLSELFENINQFRIMGGEPLLHPKCSSFIEIVRKCFPFSDIRVVTNGLLINSSSIDGNLFETMRESDALFDISMYPPTCKIWDTIKRKLYSERLHYTTTEPITVFARRCFLEKVGSSDGFWKCGITCTSVRDGKITRCGAGRAIPILANHFRIKMDENIENSGCYSIHELSITGWDLKKLLWETPFSACAYCHPDLMSSVQHTMLVDEKARFPWKADGNPKLEDWLYDGRIP